MTEKDIKKSFRVEEFEELEPVVTAAGADVTGADPEPDMSLLDRSLLPPPICPLEVFSPRVGEWIVAAAAAASAPIDYIVGSLLAATATLLGADFRGEVYRSWQEPSILWIILIGDPSSAKSPAMDTITNILREFDRECREEYQQEKQDYERRMDVTGGDQFPSVDQHDKTRKAGSHFSDFPEGGDTHRKPIRKRFFTSDSTIEALQRILVHNVHGLLLLVDEAMSLLKNFGRHGGSDKPFYIQAFGGRPYTADRVKEDEPIEIQCLGITILGSAQPEPFFAQMKASDDDGFFARVLPIWPDRVPFNPPEGEADNDFMRQCLRRLLSLRSQRCETDSAHQRTLAFSKDARDQIVEWRRERFNGISAGSSALQSFEGKLPGIVVRIAVVLECLSWAANSQSPVPSEVRLESVVAAIALIEVYMVPMYQRCLGDTALSQAEHDARTLARRIKSDGVDLLNPRKLVRDKNSPLRDRKRIDAAIRELMEAKWVSSVGGRSGNNPGRQRDDYRVNPRVFEGH